VVCRDLVYAWPWVTSDSFEVVHRRPFVRGQTARTISLRNTGSRDDPALHGSPGTSACHLGHCAKERHGTSPTVDLVGGSLFPVIEEDLLDILRDFRVEDDQAGVAIESYPVGGVVLARNEYRLGIDHDVFVMVAAQ